MISPGSPPETTNGSWARARRVGLALLLALGVASVAGSALETVAPLPGKLLAGVGKLSLASPYPKVFCRVGDEEAFGFEHVVELRYPSGAIVRAPFDRALLEQVRGPYAYKNAHGAALAFAPRLPPRTTEAVVRHGLCGDAILRGTSLDRGNPDLGRGHPGNLEAPSVVIIHSAPRGGALGAPRRTEVKCSS